MWCIEIIFCSLCFVHCKENVLLFTALKLKDNMDAVTIHDGIAQFLFIPFTRKFNRYKLCPFTSKPIAFFATLAG